MKLTPAIRFFISFVLPSFAFAECELMEVTPAWIETRYHLLRSVCAEIAAA